MTTKRNILLVDDETELVKELKWQLEDCSYHVYTASNGEEALAILESADIEVMLVDIRMPGMNGIEVIQCAIKIIPDLQCIVVTGYADIDTAVTAMRIGAVNFLCKPKEILISVLDAAIREALKKLDLIRIVAEQQKELEKRNQKLTEELKEKKMRIILTSVMQLSLEYYELTTGKTKVELAEESGIWVLTEDVNGFIPKTMKRYLKINTIPQKRPNYKAVEKTARFVLLQEPDTPYPTLKEELEESLKELRKLLLKGAEIDI
jgi:YesN/AraC family two-component response regulator